MTWNSNDGALSSDDRESCWWLLVNWWVRMMTSKNDGHISPEWCPWVMSRTLGEMMKTTWCERWLQNALISCCFRKMRVKLCKQKIKRGTNILNILDHFSNYHFLQQRNFFTSSLSAITWIEIVRTAQIKVAEKFHFSLAEQKMKLCYLAGAVTPLKRFNEFIYFELLPMKKGSHKCWKIHVFKLKSSRLVSRKLQKTRTSVMISSRMFGIFVINEAIENTCNLLKKRCLQSMIMSFAQVTTSNDDDDFHGVMTTDEPEWWVQSALMSDDFSQYWWAMSNQHKKLLKLPKKQVNVFWRQSQSLPQTCFFLSTTYENLDEFVMSVISFWYKWCLKKCLLLLSSVVKL